MQSDANIVLEQISQLGLIPNMLKLNNFNLKWEILRWQEFEVSQECFWSAKDYFKRPFPKIWISRFLIKICRIVHHRDDDVVKNPKRNCKDSGTVSTTESALCNVCSKMFSSKKALRVHIKMHDEDIRCDICSKLFTNIYILKSHKLTHTQKKEECQQCFQSVFGLKSHIKRTHSELGSKLSTCSNCGAEVKKIGNHEKICKMTAEEKATYRENLKVQCEKCPKVLANKHKLSRHVSSAHSKEMLYQCMFCDHKDNRSDNLKTHMENNHSRTIWD